jgi:hypothetical protein
MKRGRQPVLSAAALLVGIAAAWALMANRPQITPQKLKAEPPVVEVVRVTPDTVRLKVRSQGVVRPRTEIDLGGGRRGAAASAGGGGAAQRSPPSSCKPRLASRGSGGGLLSGYAGRGDAGAGDGRGTMRSLLGWFAANPIAANLLMLLIVLGGIASLGQIEQEVFPRLNLNRIRAPSPSSPSPACPGRSNRSA